MGPVGVWISADSVSLMIILFSVLVDRSEPLIARTWDAMASTGRGSSRCPYITISQAGSGRPFGEKRLPTHCTSPVCTQRFRETDYSDRLLIPTPGAATASHPIQRERLITCL